MKSGTQDMTQGSPLRLITLFALPLMLGNVFQQMYMLVDAAVVGKALGVNALAAMGAADWLNWMMLGVIQGFAQGFAILMAQQYGAKQMQALRKTVGLSVVLAGFTSVILMLLGQLLLPVILGLLDTPQEVVADSASYLRIMFWAAPVVMAYNLLASILRALGDGRTPLLAMIVASLVNIGLDLLFVLVFHWGIPGAAIATVIAQMCAAAFCLVRLSKLSIMQLQRHDFAVTPAAAWRLYRLGIPMALQNMIIAVGGLIIQRVVNGYSVAFIAGFTATNKLYGVLEIAATSYGYAMVTYVGQNLGAGKLDRIRKGITTASAVSVAISLVIGSVMLLFGKQILHLFVSGEPSDIDMAIQTGYSYLVHMSLCLPSLYILHVTRSSLQGMGNTFLPMCSGAAEFVVRTAAVLTLPLLLNAQGIYLAEVFAWIGADVILIPGCIRQIRKCST